MQGGGETKQRLCFVSFCGLQILASPLRNILAMVITFSLALHVFAIFASPLPLSHSISRWQKIKYWDAIISFITGTGENSSLHNKVISSKCALMNWFVSAVLLWLLKYGSRKLEGLRGCRRFLRIKHMHVNICLSDEETDETCAPCSKYLERSECLELRLAE